MHVHNVGVIMLIMFNMFTIVVWCVSIAGGMAKNYSDVQFEYLVMSSNVLLMLKLEAKPRIPKVIQIDHVETMNVYTKF